MSILNKSHRGRMSAYITQQKKKKLGLFAPEMGFYPIGHFTFSTFGKIWGNLGQFKLSPTLLSQRRTCLSERVLPEQSPSRGGAGEGLRAKGRLERAGH